MSYYIENPAMCRVDFFKESGKWYTTEAINFDGCDWENDHGAEALRKALRKQIGTRLSGMNAVCLDPYIKHSYPVMIRNWG